MVREGTDLVARVKKLRDVTAVQHESYPNVAETLERIRKFLQDHETPSQNECTHMVFDCYKDWWVTPNSSYKLSIIEDNTVEILNQYIRDMYLLQVPLMLTEKRTDEIRFLQDITLEGTETDTVKLEELISADSAFLRLVGSTLGEVYRQTQFLDVAVFDATGFSNTKGLMKASIRLVWPALKVDQERALRIRGYMVHKFQESSDPQLAALSSRIQELNPERSKDSVWASLFGADVYQSRVGVRMPLCDRVSPKPMVKAEQRPFVPMGVWRCKYQEAKLEDVELICGREELEGHEWLKIGSIRCSANTELTPWAQPTWQAAERVARVAPGQTAERIPWQPQLGERRPGHAVAGSMSFAPDAAPVVAAVAATGRASGQVKVRTHGGSPTGPSRQRQGNKPRVEQRTMTVEREFDGTMDQFRERLESQLGNFTEEEGTLTWRQDNSVSLTFKASSRRVYITCKAHQVRTIAAVVEPFSLGEAARSTITQTARSRGPTVAGGGYSGGASAAASLAPSAVYRPTQAPSQASSTPSVRSRPQEQVFEQSHRVVTRDFQGTAQGELSINVGDIVHITHDPEAVTCTNSDRWVHGKNETSNEIGWFLLSFATQEPSNLAESATADNVAQEGS